MTDKSYAGKDREQSQVKITSCLVFEAARAFLLPHLSFCMSLLSSSNLVTILKIEWRRAKWSATMSD